MSGAACGRGTIVVGTAVARLNGAHRRHDPRTRFQQFGQTAAVQLGHSRNGAMAASPELVAVEAALLAEQGGGHAEPVHR